MISKCESIPIPGFQRKLDRWRRKCLRQSLPASRWFTPGPISTDSLFSGDPGEHRDDDDGHGHDDGGGGDDDDDCGVPWLDWPGQTQAGQTQAAEKKDMCVALSFQYDLV